ncbi:hypothetical protein [Williamsia herbipolensis]|uniref:hypothetical protein n=1 Tax=Williamsia herbipolensis TaxID=1603258 RepID=UPI0005F7FDBE|nr:hypothetical protein [Williamsia herbipolensis]
MKIRRYLTSAMVAAVAASVLSSVGVTAAQADVGDDYPVGLAFDAETVSVISKTGQPITFGKTTLSSRTDLTNLVGTLNLPQTTAALKLGPLTLATFTISIVEPTKVTGTIAQGEVDGRTTLDLKVAQSFKIRLDKVAPLGIGSLGSSDLTLVPAGGNCATQTTTANLTGSIDAAKLFQDNTADTHVKGSYTIPEFQGDCGLFAPIINALIAGPNNTLDVHLTNPVFDFGSTSRAAAVQKVLAD